MTPTATRVPLCVDRARDWLVQRRRWVLLAILLLYAAGFNGQWRLGPDTAVHMQIARSLVRGEGYHHPTALHESVNPGLPTLMAANQRLFGEQTLWPLHLLMLGVGLLGLYLAYRLYLTHGDDPGAALACTVLLAVTETYYRYNYHLLTDLPFTVALILMLLGFERLARQRGGVVVNVLLITLATVVMALFRSVVLVVLVAAAAVMVWRLIAGPHRRRYALVLAGLLAAMILARLIDPRLTYLGDVGADEAQIGQRLVERLHWTLQKAFTQNLPRIFNEDLSEAVFGLDLGPWISVILAIALLGLTIAVSRRRPLWLMLIAAFLAQWVLFASTDRYMLVLIPLLVLGWWRGAAAINRRLGEPRGGWVFAAMLALWIVPNMVTLGKLTVDQRHVPFAAHYERGKYVALARLAEQVDAYADRGDLVIASNALELTWLADRAVVDDGALPIQGKAAQHTIQTLHDAPRVLAVTPLRGRLKEQFTALGLSLSKKLAVVTQPNHARSWALHMVNVGDPAAALHRYRAARRARADAGASALSGRPQTTAKPGANADAAK